MIKQGNKTEKARLLGGVLTQILFAALLGGLLLGPAAGGEPGVQSTGEGSGDTLEAILMDLAVYDFAVGVGAPMRLRAYVFAHKDDPETRQDTEKRLLSFLESRATPGGKMEACRSLRLIGSPAAVPVLGRLLLKSQTTDMARYALERIPGKEAENALLGALDKARGSIQLGIIFSLGERSEASVPALERLARGGNRAAASAAVLSLGRIGGQKASKVLAALISRSAPDPLKSEVLSALLVIAQGYLRADEKAEAGDVYEFVLAANPSPGLRRAAFKGKIAAAAAEEGRDHIVKTLSNPDTGLQDPAISMIPEVFKPDQIGRIAALLAGLPEQKQIHLLAVLADYPGNLVAKEIAAAGESSSVRVRMEAYRGLEKTGNASFVGYLAERSAQTKGREQAAAREALWRLKGVDVDAAIVEGLEKEEDEQVRNELILAAGERRIEKARDLLLETIRSGTASARLRAIRAVREIAVQADIGILLDLLLILEEGSAREGLQNTIAAVARRNPRLSARGNEAEALLANETDPRKKGDLLRVLGKIGDDTSLPQIRTALSDNNASVVDAAVRALAEWPTVTARDDVYETARTSLNMTHRVLSLRAYVRMIGLEPHRQPEGVVADLQKALAVSPRPEEKKLILGMLPRFPCVSGLKTAESMIADRAIREEAKLAADRIRAVLAELR